jgi:Ankyrin repeats (3 copies)/Ankyrin repeats (many copies)
VRKISDERTSSTTSGNSQSGAYGDWKPTTLENEHTIIAEFYYSFRGGCKETSHKLMLQSIVYQIWKQNYRLFPLIQDRYRAMRSKAEILWSYDNLKSALDSLHSIDFDLKIVIVVDAIDESDVYNRNDVLNFLSLFSSCKSRCNIRLLVASRPEIKPNLDIGKFSHIILQKENKADIQIVVNKWIKSFEQSLNCELLSKVGEDIVKNSDGVFLWVTLVLRDLEEYITRGGYSEAGLWRRLRGLPRDLGGRNGFYRAMIDSLINGSDQGRDQEEKEERKEHGQRTLAWTTFPKRPLFSSELREALAVPAPSRIMDPPTYNLARNRPKELDRGILSFCGGLVEVRFVVYARNSTKIFECSCDRRVLARSYNSSTKLSEFLLDRKPPPPAEPYDLYEAQGDFEIAYTCCRYLRTAFEAPIPQMEADSEFSQVEKMVEHISNHPLLKYIITYFKGHLNHLGPEIECSRIKGEFESFITAIGNKSYSSLFLSQWIRSMNWANVHLDTDGTSATSCLNSALTCAAGAGKDRALEVFLALGANVDCLNHDGSSPLVNAAQFNRVHTVTLLLEAGAVVDAQEGHHGSALQAASRAGHSAVVRLLLETGKAYVESKDRFGWTPLLRAAERGHEAVVKQLLETGGAYVESKDRFGWTPLLRAAELGHEAVVKQLLETGKADVEVTDRSGRTPLSRAAKRGHEAVVKQLLETGKANVETMDRSGRTPLS